MSDPVSMTYLVMQTPILPLCSLPLFSIYALFACALNTQWIKNLLSRTWVFSIALDSATHHSRSFLGVLIQIFLSKRVWQVFNFHLAALSIQYRYTGEFMLKILLNLFNAVCSDWKTQLLDLSSDGAQNMTAHFCNVVTCLGNVFAPDFPLNCVWFGVHLLEFFIQHVSNNVVRTNIFTVMTSFISHLFRQQILLASI